jgi:hypothetical protein
MDNPDLWTQLTSWDGFGHGRPNSGKTAARGSTDLLEADFWKVSGIPLVRLKLHREVNATVKLAVQKQE